ncbi:MAG: hypothetical protein J0M12_06930 [Deltaproteobacteria bacterium]|nr:hypothetical protein [Deltaproteobacteria bacterium]
MKRTVLAGLLALALLPASVRAEDINAIFKKVNDLIAAKNYSKALEELGWAQKELEKMNITQVQSFFPDSLAGFTGSKFEANSALGMTNIEREYSKGSEQIKIALSGSSAGGAGAGGLGGLAAFGRMAAMMGGGQGQDTFRISGRTASLQNADGGSPQLQVFLDSGSVLTLEGQNGTTGDSLKSVAEALKINELDNYLRGQS